APAAFSASAPGPAAYAPPAGGLDPRQLWPNILEAVKNRRRFTWILLSQNAHVAGFDGTTLQLGFVNAGARDNFASSGSEEVLRQALSEQFSVQWKIEAVVDPSGGGAAPPASGGFTGGGSGSAGGGYGGGGNAGGGYGTGNTAGYGAPAPQTPPSAQSPSAPASRPTSTVAPAPAPAPQRSAPEPPPVSIEDDIPEDDDPDLNESALSGRELIVRELGATVVEEITNE
ncbi:DNA polymerase III subunit gamma and tau, partial [Streptomyces sp. SID5470]|nr:DNA polymerase III subunit gamma and tau [Streptomyces sp. SID5470]